MLRLKNIGREYPSVHALQSVNITLPEKGLVLVTGAPGSGKSTLLRILAGRDTVYRGEILRYAERVTRYGERERSAYRRAAATNFADTILPERSAAENAVLSARIAGMSRRKAEEKADSALTLLGAGAWRDRLYAELSKSEQCLVRLACAIAREADALWLDEPTEGLDEETESEVLSLLAQIAEDRLVTVFSRKELFSKDEARRIVLRDGQIASDSAEEPDVSAERPTALPKGAGASVSFGEAIRNLGRRDKRVTLRLLSAFLAAFLLCTAFAAALGAGENARRTEAESLAAYPIVLTKQSVTSGDLGAVDEFLTNRLASDQYTIRRSYALEPTIYSGDTARGARLITPTEGANWVELPEGDELRETSYELVSGRWPTAADEAVLLLGSGGILDGSALHSLGLTDEETPQSYMDVFRLSYRLVLPGDRYVQNADGSWGAIEEDSMLAALVNRSMRVDIVGVLSPRAEAQRSAVPGGVGYTAALSRYVTESVPQNALVLLQLADPSVDALTGLPFDTRGLLTETDAREALLRWSEELDAAQSAALCKQWTKETVPEGETAARLRETIETMEDAEAKAYVEQYITAAYSSGSAEENLTAFGLRGAQELTEIRVFAASYEARRLAVAQLAAAPETLSVSEDAARALRSAEAMSTQQKTLSLTLRVVGIAFAVLFAALVFGAVCPERKREGAALYALGMSRSDVRGILRTESLLLGAVGAAAGVLLVNVLLLSALSLIPGLTPALTLRDSAAAGIITLLASFLGTWFGSLGTAKE